MLTELSNEQFFRALTAGDRPAARTIVEEFLASGVTPGDLIEQLFWPTHEAIVRLRRADQLSSMGEHMASRLLRGLVDQNAARLAAQPSRNRTIYAFCGSSELEELGAQMAVDVLESEGFTVRFAGGGVANDEILSLVQNDKPDVLLMFCSAPGDLPNIRALIDTLGEIGACPNLQIAVGGGVFNRAEGLAEEIGADVWAYSPLEVAEALIEEPARRADPLQRTVGKMRKARKAA